MRVNYLYRDYKNICCKYSNTDSVFITEFEILNSTYNFLKSFVNLYIREIATLQDITGRLYHIFLNEVNSYDIDNDNNGIEIFFKDNTSLLIYYPDSLYAVWNNFYFKKLVKGYNILSDNLINWYYVSSDFTNENNCYSDLQTCIDTVPENSYIYIYNDTYSYIVIDKSINLYFDSEAIITASNHTNINITAAADVNIYGNVQLINTSDNSLINTNNSDINLYLEFELLRSTDTSITSGELGNVILKGVNIETLSRVNPNFGDVTVNTFILDCARLFSNSQNFWSQFNTYDTDYIRLFKNSRMLSRSYNINIEHPENPYYRFENCLFENSNNESAITTLTGSPVNNARIYLSDCFFNKGTSEYDIYGTTSDAEGKIYLNMQNDCYGLKGLYNCEYENRNGKKFMVENFN